MDRCAHRRRETELKSLIAFTVGCACLASLAASAQNYLPDATVVANAIQQRLEVMAAADRIDAATAYGRAIAIGDHETELLVNPQRRSSDYGPDSNEWEFQLTRRFRLPGKADLDRSIGEYVVQTAAISRKAIEHDASVTLLHLWMDWLRTGANQAQAEQQLESLGQARDALARREALGDAASLDVNLIDAEVAQAVVIYTEHKTAHQATSVALSQAFPALPLPVRLPLLPEPKPLQGEPDEWVERIIEHNHELLGMTADASRHALLATRARADRIGDPSLGLRVVDEQASGDRSVGIMFSIPVGTANRSALAGAAAAEARAYQQDAAALRRHLETSARTDVIQATNAVTRWQAQQRAYQAMSAAAARIRTAWDLGEIELAEKLLAERREREAAIEEQRVRSEALTRALQLQIDSHELWATD